MTERDDRRARLRGLCDDYCQRLTVALTDDLRVELRASERDWKALAAAIGELDEERKKVGLLMQKAPEGGGDFPWQMMRLWLFTRDEEKRAHRKDREALAEARDLLVAFRGADVIDRFLKRTELKP